MIKKIAILGAEQMGVSLTHLCTKAGYQVIFYDHRIDVLTSSQALLEREMETAVARGKLAPEHKVEAISRLKTTQQLEICGTCDLVFDFLNGEPQEKEILFQQLTPFLTPYTHLATQTSLLSVTQLATFTDRPDRFMGLHFMTPVLLTPLVELVRGLATSLETVDVIKRMVVRLGKTPVESKDYPGFIVNRLLAPLINEAIYALYEGVGSLQTIDTAMRLGTNQSMGPLELADFIGLDTCLSILRLLSRELGGTRYHPCPLLVKYVEAGWLGRKTGRGFYDYRQMPPVPVQ